MNAGWYIHFLWLIYKKSQLIFHAPQRLSIYVNIVTNVSLHVFFIKFIKKDVMHAMHAFGQMSTNFSYYYIYFRYKRYHNVTFI